MKRFVVLFAMIAIGCSDQPSHVPNPLLLPFHTVSAGVQNAAYEARRAKVTALVRINHQLIVRDLRSGGGPALDAVMAQARIPAPKRAEVAEQLAKDIPQYEANTEALIIALMVHGE